MPEVREGVLALAVQPADLPNPGLYVAGEFRVAGNQPFYSFARWLDVAPAPPMMRFDAFSTQPGTPLTLDVLANDEAELTLVSVSQPISGTASIVENKVRYTPNSGTSGTDRFTYRARKVNGAENVADVIVVILAPTTPTQTPVTPVASPTTQPTNQPTPVATQTPIPTATPAPKLNAQSSITGAPGSRFIFTGENFPANQQVSVSLIKVGVNAADSAQSSASSVRSDANGRVSFTLVTSNTLVAGNYSLVVGAVSAPLTLDTNALVQQPAVQGEVVEMSEVVDLPQRLFLPVVLR